MTAFEWVSEMTAWDTPAFAAFAAVVMGVAGWLSARGMREVSWQSDAARVLDAVEADLHVADSEVAA